METVKIDKLHSLIGTLHIYVDLNRVWLSLSKLLAIAWEPTTPLLPQGPWDQQACAEILHAFARHLFVQQKALPRCVTFPQGPKWESTCELE